MGGSRREGEEEVSTSEAELDGKRGAGYHDTIWAEHHGTSRECDGGVLESNGGEKVNVVLWLTFCLICEPGYMPRRGMMRKM